MVMIHGGVPSSDAAFYAGLFFPAVRAFRVVHFHAQGYAAQYVGVLPVPHSVTSSVLHQGHPDNRLVPAFPDGLRNCHKASTLAREACCDISYSFSVLP